LRAMEAGVIPEAGEEKKKGKNHKQTGGKGWIVGNIDGFSTGKD